jgi:hypothetical protein
MDSDAVASIVQQELDRISDPTLAARIRSLLVRPYAVDRAWDYGPEGQHYVCWTILEHPASNTGVAYCTEGFGPAHPWGLIFLSGSHMSIGMDCAWYACLEDAFRESRAWDAANPDGYEVR